MAIEEAFVPGERVEVLSDGSLQVRDATLVMRDGEIDRSFPPKYYRYVLSPGDDLSGKPDRVTAVAQAVWTEDVLSAWATAHPPES